MNIDYSLFLKMIPEVTLMTILVIAFIADFCSSKASERKWFNPLMCVLMLVHILINLSPVATSTTFGGMFHRCHQIYIGRGHTDCDDSGKGMAFP